MALPRRASGSAQVYSELPSSAFVQSSVELDHEDETREDAAEAAAAQRRQQPARPVDTASADTVVRMTSNMIGGQTNHVEVTSPWRRCAQTAISTLHKQHMQG